MTTCLNCGGLIAEPGKPYGYAGRFCYCPIHPSRMYQNPSDKPLRLVSMFADEDDLRRWLARQRPMTAEERNEQRVSFVYGQIGGTVSKDEVRRKLAEQYGGTAP